MGQREAQDEKERAAREIVRFRGMNHVFYGACPGDAISLSKHIAECAENNELRLKEGK